MRLTCPNCGAQYEVPTEVIPQGGRDVQCSSCAHTWFQNHPDDLPEPPADSVRSKPADPAAAPVTDPEPAPIADAPSGNDDARHAAEAAPAPPAAARAAKPPAAARAAKPPATARTTPPPPQDEYDDDGDNAPDPAPPLPARDGAGVRARSLDPSVAEVLREEAARESRQRAAEFSGLESQPDLGLDQPAPESETARRARESRERMARMRGTPPADGPADPAPDRPGPDPAGRTSTATAAAAQSRRDLLPDVEEINQTLRSSRERREVETPQGRAPLDEPDSGFGRGFIIVLLLAAVLAGLYVLAPRIAEALPPAAPALQGYVDIIDAGRLWLDAQVTSLLTDAADAPAPD